MKEIQHNIVLSKIIGTCDADDIYYSPGPDEFVDLHIDIVSKLIDNIENHQVI